MELDLLGELTAGRDLSTKAFASACYAPFTSMFLDPQGNVLACCQNTGHRLGNISDAPLADIWRGSRTTELRGALRKGDLSRGCAACAWQHDRGSWADSLAVSFDRARVDDAEPRWPRQIEFALSTTCNLECAMCNGEWSSRIRVRRERRPPLPAVYGEAFFEEIDEFLPHLEAARFLGGEPFLAAESLRMMDLMIDRGLDITANVQTNGTQWNSRVERILDQLPLSISVSLDAVTKETFESIRVGASFDAVMANLLRYRAATDRWGTPLDLAFCFMVQNHHEFGDFLAFADEVGSRVWVVTVVHPSFSPYQLPAPEFDALLAALEAQDPAMQSRLQRNLPQWDTELARLRSWRDRDLDADRQGPGQASGAGSYVVSGPLPPDLTTPRPVETRWLPEEALARALADLPGAETSLARRDAGGEVVSVGIGGREAGASFIGVSATDCVGQPWAALAGRLGRLHGVQVSVVREVIEAGACHRHVVLGDPRSGGLYLRLLTYPEFDDGELSGSVTAAAWSPDPPPWANPG